MTTIRIWLLINKLYLAFIEFKMNLKFNHKTAFICYKWIKFDQTVNIRFSGTAEMPTILRKMRKVQDPLSPPPKAQLFSWAFFMPKRLLLKVHYSYI